MIKKNTFEKISIITIIVSLFFSFSFLVGFTNSRAGTPLNKIPNENILLDDGEENGSGEEESSDKGLNIEKLIELVGKVTSKHLAILQEVHANAPEAAQGAIERAMQVSMRGSIRAIKALNKIKTSNKDNGDNNQKTFHIIASCNRGGTIYPKGIQFTEGGSLTFKITADDGYTLAWVRVDNEKLEGITSYAFDDIDANHTIHAHFKKIKNSPNENSNNG